MATSNRNNAGGAAGEGGYDFQGAVNAIVATHIIRGRALKWFDGLIVDTPLVIDAETGGAGDDQGLCFPGDNIAEVQIKRGLTRTRLWDPLMKLAHFVTQDESQFGALVVCANTSSAIRAELKDDIKRIGSGRQDDLKEISMEFLTKLEADGLDPQVVCSRLRIVIVHALAASDSHIGTARELLVPLLIDPAQLEAAWQILYKDGRKIIQHRLRRTASNITKVLRSGTITLSTDSSMGPASVVAALIDKASRYQKSFKIPTVQRSLDLKSNMLDISAVVDEDWQIPDVDLSEALKSYHGFGTNTRDKKAVHPLTIGHSRHNCVIRAGPGMGKSILANRLTRKFADEHIPVCHVGLRKLAKKIENGATPITALLESAVDGTPIELSQLTSALKNNLIFVLDGLDEMEAIQEVFAVALAAFAEAYPQAKIIITTRPIGYETAQFENWRHYLIIGLTDTSFSTNDVGAKVKRLLTGLMPDTPDRCTELLDANAHKLANDPTKSIINSSPFMLATATALIFHERRLGDTALEFIDEAIDLFLTSRTERTQNLHYDKETLTIVAQRLGWETIVSPLTSRDDLIAFCADHLAPKLGVTSLAANSTVRDCIAYLEATGLIEAVAQKGQAILTFVHKLFGEHLAAQYVSALGVDKRVEKIELCVENTNAAVVVSNLAEMGFENDVLQVYVALNTTQNVYLKHALRLLRDYPESLDENLSEPFLITATSVIAGAHRSDAYAVGSVMAQLAPLPRYKVVDKIRDLTNSTQIWTQAISWLCLLQARADIPDTKPLVDLLPRAMQEHSGMLWSTTLQDRPFFLGFGSFGDNLLSVLYYEAASLVVDRAPNSEAAAQVVQLFGDQGGVPLDYYKSIKAIFDAHGLKFNWAEPESSYSNFDALFARQPEEDARCKRHWQSFLQAIVTTLDQEGSTSISDSEPALVTLATLMESIDFPSKVHGAIKAKTEPANADLVEDLVQVILNATDFNREQLANDATTVLARMADPDDRYGHYPRLMLPDVDLAPINWETLRDQALNIDHFIALSAQPADWVSWPAANVVSGLATPETTEEIAYKFWSYDTEFTNRVGAAFASDLDRAAAIRLLVDRLAQGHRAGSWDFYRYLLKLAVTPEEMPCDILEDGLKDRYFATAKAAAKLVQHLTEKHGGESWMPLLEEAYRYWQTHEEPYPERGGVVPQTPRPEILAAMGPPSKIAFEIISNGARDKHSDVTNLCGPEYARRVQGNEDLRKQWVGNIFAEKDASILRLLLASRVPFDEGDLDVLVPLLNHAQEDWRDAALLLLNNGYLPDKVVSIKLRDMARDPSAKIRDRVIELSRTLLPAD